MKYLVVTRYLPIGETEWREVRREFNDEERAINYAEDMYECNAQEINVLIYELKKSYN